MSTTPSIAPPGAARQPTPDSVPIVDVLICGSIDRGDDGAPLAAADLLEAERPANARIQRIGQLDVDDLLAVPRDGGVVIVDAATGIDPGTILELPLRGFLTPNAAVQARSSHALALPEVIGLAEMIRGRPLAGRIVVIGARRFTLGRPLTRRVTSALPSLSRAIRAAVERVTESLLGADSSPLGSG